MPNSYLPWAIACVAAAEPVPFSIVTSMPALDQNCLAAYDQTLAPSGSQPSVNLIWTFFWANTRLGTKPPPAARAPAATKVRRDRAFLDLVVVLRMRPPGCAVCKFATQHACQGIVRRCQWHTTCCRPGMGSADLTALEARVRREVEM